MRARLLALAVVLAGLAALQPATVLALWWPPDAYSDPPYFCLSQTQGGYQSIQTNDPQVGNNPEQDTFFGYHADPGWDNWYGYWTGDINGTPGTVTGWRLIVNQLAYPQHYHWNFGTWGWNVYGHIRQFIAYWNPTFDGQCGWSGGDGPPPYMADQFGVPVADFYVDNQPPTNPDPFISAFSLNSVSFSWRPVVDQGAGAGADYFASGFDHFSAWLTVNGGGAQQSTTATSPQVLTAANLLPGDSACVHVIAYDKLYNATGEQQACGGPAVAPPAPPPPSAGAVAANPSPVALTGLPSWFWLTPTLYSTSVLETYQGRYYKVVMYPSSTAWDFGDGTQLSADQGSAYPWQSDVEHAYQTESAAGYTVRATETWGYGWYVRSGWFWSGPYPMASQSKSATPLIYQAEQAQPELVPPP